MAGSSNHGHSAGQAQSTMDSQPVVDALEPVLKMAKSIGDELVSQENVAKDLRRWLKGIDPRVYTQTRPWPKALDDAYDHYKALGEVAMSKCAAFKGCMGNTPKRDATVEDHHMRAELALKWANAAMRAAEARLLVLVNYRTAYPYKTIEGHIEQAEKQIDQGWNAINEAKQNHRRIFIKMHRNHPSDGVFR